MKNLTIISLCAFLLVALSFNVNAFGVSSPYWDENPLFIHPGETKEVVMVLQNMVGGEDLTVVGTLNSGKEIAKLTDEVTTYSVALGQSNIPVHLQIYVPADANPGQEWQVGVSFKTISPNKEGLSIGTGIDKGFKVKIIEQPKETTRVSNLGKGLQPVIGFIVLIVILVLLFLFIKYFYKGRDNKNAR